MDARELFQSGRLEEALSELKQQIRGKPGDPNLRVFLFQLLSVVGDWERALDQLELVGEMDDDSLLMVQLYRVALECEPLRAGTFAGERTPLFVGEPGEWQGAWAKANELAGQGHAEASEKMREQAWGEMPSLSGTINGEPFEWIMDGDSRLGPCVEAMLENKYFWVPLTCVRKMQVEEPTDVRHLVWVPVMFEWQNGGDVGGLMPVRYPGSESHEDSAIRLARRTDWVEQDGAYHGVGQKMLLTDAGEYPLLEAREIRIEVDESAEEG